MRMNIFLVLIIESTVCFATPTICPTPVVDDIGALYHTQERFDKVREGNNELTTNYVHYRHDKDDKGGEEYKYIVRFCGPNNTAAVVQIEEKTKERIIGKFDNAAVLIGAEDWLLIQYFHGGRYNSHCNVNEKQAWISITCEDQGRKPQLRVIEEARFPNDIKHKKHPDTICYFLFEYNHPGACSPAKTKSLSGGAVFCIIIIVLLLSYFTFGFIYQRFVMRATGLEQIPHYSFWRKFGNTMADGCNFVCRREVKSNTYKGITDDLDVESSDDDKDGLLPM